MCQPSGKSTRNAKYKAGNLQSKQKYTQLELTKQRVKCGSANVMQQLKKRHNQQ